MQIVKGRLVAWEFFAQRLYFLLDGNVRALIFAFLIVILVLKGFGKGDFSVAFGRIAVSNHLIYY